MAPIRETAFRVIIALEETRTPYLFHRLDLKAGEQRAPEHLARNPAGKVPTIVETSEDGRLSTISQSNAILLHLANRNPHVSLLPLDPSERVLALERFFYLLIFAEI